MHLILKFIYMTRCFIVVMLAFLYVKLVFQEKTDSIIKFPSNKLVLLNIFFIFGSQTTNFLLYIDKVRRTGIKG